MKKSNNPLFIVSSIVLFIPMIVGIILWNKLPDKMPTSFDFSGTPTAYSSKMFAAIGLYIMLFLIHLFVAFMVGTESRKPLTSKAIGIIMLICPALSVFLSICIYGTALGKEIAIPPLLNLFLGFIYLIIGNYLPKIRRNFVVGVQIKWALESDKNWESTTRFSGYTMFITGLLLVILGMICFFVRIPDTPVTFLIIMCILLFPVFAMAWHSYNYYRKHKDEADYYSN